MFDFDCTLHKFNYLIPEETLQKLYTQGSGQAWRDDLKEGDMVDALIHHYDRTGSLGGGGWSQAKIGRIDTDSLYLEFPNDSKEADR